MTKDEIIQYHLKNEEARYAAEKEKHAADKEKQKTLRYIVVALLISFCFYVYFGIPVVESGANVSEQSVAVAGSSVGGDITNGF